MPKGDILGEFELMVLAAAQRLGDDAYAMTIRQELADRAKRSASIGAIHAALERLGEKGFVAFRVSAPLPVPGGRSRKYAHVTPAGLRALRRSTEALVRMLEGLHLGIDAS
jgi:PadR family transcriptional regulator, regulatory protein PadR